MVRCLYIVKSNGDPVYRRSYEEDDSVNCTIPSFVRHSVALFHSRDSTSSERVYTLEHNDDLWAYSFFNSFVLLALTNNEDSLVPLKSMVQSLGRAISHQYGDVLSSWSGSMAEIVDMNNLCDNYTAMNMGPAKEAHITKIRKLVDKSLERPEIAFIGVFDPSGKMVSGNVPELHLFRIEVEITQGTVKPIMDIAPTAINSGDDRLQMLRVNSLTVVVAAQPEESPLYAIGAIGEIAHDINEIIS